MLLTEFPTLTGILVLSAILFVIALQRKLTNRDMYTFTFFVTMLYMMSPFALIGLIILPISMMIVKRCKTHNKLLLLISALTPVFIYSLEFIVGASLKLFIVVFGIELIFIYFHNKYKDLFTRLFTTYMIIITPLFIFPTDFTPYIQYLTVILFPIYIKIEEKLIGVNPQ